MTGYKATNADMTCKGHKFELGKWYEIDGEIELCKRGFHFCVSPSGVYAYYTSTDVRVFECEAEQVMECPIEVGADSKLVAKRIRLTREITPGSKTKGNDGDRNTGDRNTGDRNTGDRNTGHWNTGDQNTGDWNTGVRNTGHCNTGDRNTGDRNTGVRNTGSWNTGNWNTADRCAGFFCCKEPKVASFDVQTDLTNEEFLSKYPESHKLGELLRSPKEIPFAEFKHIPGISLSKLDKLHKTYLSKLHKSKGAQ